MGSLLGQHRDDARLAAAGAVLFAASYLLMQAFGPDFELPPEPIQPNLSAATLKTQPVHPLPALPALLPVALP